MQTNQLRRIAVFAASIATTVMLTSCSYATGVQGVVVYADHYQRSTLELVRDFPESVSAPAAGVLVRAVARDGSIVGQGETDADGRFRFQIDADARGERVQVNCPGRDPLNHEIRIHPKDYRLAVIRLAPARRD